MNRDIVERVARAWASIDGKAGRFDSGKINDHDGYYEGYMSEAKELMKRSGLDEMVRALEVISEPGWHPENMRRIASEALKGK